MICGKNAVDNWRLIDNANESDIWYHLKSLPSPHVIASSNEDPIICALHCKSKSKYKNLSQIKVIYTPCSNLIKGDTPGSVLFKSNNKVKSVTI